jgi:hypothetical protein
MVSLESDLEGRVGVYERAAREPGFVGAMAARKARRLASAQIGARL